MLSRLELKLNMNEESVNYNVGSIFHGFLMGKVAKAYGEKMHDAEFNPFSQFIYKKNTSDVFWQINTLNQIAFEKIILPIKDTDQPIFLKQRNKELSYSVNLLSQVSYQELVKKCYQEDANEPIFKLKFLSPFGFKVKGEYQIFPDLRTIFRNIMNRFDTFSIDYKVFDLDALEHLVEKSKIVGYKLKTTRFYLEKTKIPAIQGEMVIYVGGSRTMVNLVALLFEFAQYSGIGIKTSLGMGGCERLQ